ncbi:PREDICTED: F-box/kelch-repeat protein At3g23880-like [Populus euphratica]|uniref:F-box/kelch-repeat protein At3g23880-like n=1 Tax=Populus euphratica TaxID=75702 RepID=A0AAJ6UDP1_POPEU|nr:PREDICTED: F-box/kelch-repeat protein At3g23880-like [Populus euphratica]
MAESVKKNRVPEDVLIDILIALPIKSLLRFRSLSKSWNSVISDKDFISAFWPKPNHRFSFVDGKIVKNPTLCSCNGVVRLSDINQGRTKSLILWNPAIRKHLNLALPKLCGPHSANWGFGFDLPSNDYRFVRVARQVSSKREFPMEFQVFSLKRRYWERINFSPTLGPFCVAPDGCNSSGHCNQDATQWMVISEFDDSLGALFYRCAAKYADLWFMREYGVRNSWNRLYRVRVDGFTRAMVFRKNVEILIRKHGGIHGTDYTGFE